MRKWTWLVLVTSGALAWACGGDDDGGSSNDNTSSTGGSGGTGGGDGGNGGSDATTTSGGGNGGSGGNGASTTSSTTSSTTGSGGTSTTTGTTGSAGGAGDAGAAGMAGAAGAGGDPPTIEEVCAASCAAQDASACPDPICAYTCPYGAVYPECEEAYIAQQTCATDTGFECVEGYPLPPAACQDETDALAACIAAEM